MIGNIPRGKSLFEGRKGDANNLGKFVKIVKYRAESWKIMETLWKICGLGKRQHCRVKIMMWLWLWPCLGDNIWKNHIDSNLKMDYYSMFIWLMENSAENEIIDMTKIFAY